MLLWLGLFLIAVGLASFAIDRRAANMIHDDVPQKYIRIAYWSTDYAKGAHWLVAAIVGYAAARAIAWKWGTSPSLHLLEQSALAFLASLAIGSIILHTTKIVLGRRRPRDELDFGLYGFRPFLFDLQHDSFPSGHALTIFSVAVVLSGAIPMLAPVWFLAALYLALTRALLNSHFLSDVFIGAGLGTIVTREVVMIWFPVLARSWF